MEYQTSDIVLASYLRLCGHDIVRINKVGLKGTFVFVDIDDDLIQGYDVGRARVEPVAFNNTIKSLTTAVRRME
jgi:hypothetical protein